MRGDLYEVIAVGLWYTIVLADGSRPTSSFRFKDPAELRLIGLFQMRIMLKVCLCHGQTCWQHGVWD